MFADFCRKRDLFAQPEHLQLLCLADRDLIEGDLKAARRIVRLLFRNRQIFSLPFKFKARKVIPRLGNDDDRRLVIGRKPELSVRTVVDHIAPIIDVRMCDKIPVRKRIIAEIIDVYAIRFACNIERDER